MKLFVHKNLLLSLVFGDLMYTLERKLFKSWKQHSVSTRSVGLVRVSTDFSINLCSFTFV